MKVIVLSQYWHPENGVPQRRWSWLSKILVDLGHEVIAMAPPPHYGREISFRHWITTTLSQKHSDLEPGPSGEKIVRTAYFPAGRSVTQRALNQATVALGAIWTIVRRPKWLREFSPDLFIATVPALPTAFVAYLAGKILKIPYHIDLRDAWPDLLEQSGDWNRATGRRSIRERLLTKGPFQVVSIITRKIVNLSLKHAESIIVTSELLETDLRSRKELYLRGRAPSVVTIRNLFPPESRVFSEKNVSSLRSAGQLNVLYAGTLGRAQNLLNVLDAFEIARDMGVNVQLRMVGAGASREALTERIKNHQLDVSIEGKKPASELLEDYMWADTALVHLTDWEPLKRAVPSKTYELMAAGLHISGVLDGEAADLIRDLNAGHVVPPESPAELAELWRKLSNERRLLDVSSRGAEWVDRQERVVVPSVLSQLLSEKRE